MHRLLADGPTVKAIAVAAKPTRDATVAELADAFLLATKATVKAATHYGYACLLRKVTDAFYPASAVGLKAKDVTRWLPCRPCSPSTRSGVGGVIAVAYRWAEAEGVIAATRCGA